MPKTKANPHSAPQPGVGSLTHHPFAKLSTLQASVRRSEAPSLPIGAPNPPSLGYSLSQRVRIRQELTGRSGKVVTRVSGLPGSNLEAIAAQMRAALGCAAAIEPPDVLLGGSLEARALAWIERAGDLHAIRSVTKPPPTRAPEAQSMEASVTTSVGNGTVRRDIRRGQSVAIVLKADQGSGRLTEGVVRDILTNSNVHPRGIKVRLEDGQVGRVKMVLSPLRPEPPIHDRS